MARFSPNARVIHCGHVNPLNGGCRRLIGGGRAHGDCVQAARAPQRRNVAEYDMRRLMTHRGSAACTLESVAAPARPTSGPGLASQPKYTAVHQHQ
jgi:hypothetical protein